MVVVCVRPIRCICNGDDWAVDGVRHHFHIRVPHQRQHVSTASRRTPSRLPVLGAIYVRTSQLADDQLELALVRRTG